MQEINKPDGIAKDADKAVESVKSLKSQLNELKQTMGNLDEGSVAFKNAAAEAGQLQERIRGVNDAIENADPEKKFAPFSRTIQGLAGGFSAAQGAMALFGSESKDLEKTLLKVQGAMAFSQGLNSLLEFKNDIMELGNLVKTNLTTAFKNLGNPLAITGIAITALATAFYAVATAAAESAKAQIKSLGELQIKLNETYDIEIKLAKIAGKNTEELERGMLEGRRNTLREQIKISQTQLDRQLWVTDEEQAAHNKLLTDLSKANNDYLLFEAGISQKKVDKNKETNEKKAKDNKEAEEKRKKKAEEKKNNKLKEAEEDYKFYQDLSKKESDKRIQDSKDEFDAELSSAQNKAETETSVYYKENKQRLQDKKDAADADKKLDEAQLQSKMALYSAIGQGLGSLSQIAGQETEAGKALAIAQATIDTYAGATKEFGKGGVLGFITGAAVIAAGLANVQKIISVKVPKSSGNKGSTPSVSASAGNAIQPPIFNKRLKEESDNLNSGNNTNSGQGQKQEQLRVYVVANDITNAQNDIKTIIERSTIK